VTALTTLRHAVGDVELSDLDERVLAYLADNPPSTVNAIADLLRRARAAAERRQPDLAALAELLQVVAAVLDPAPLGGEYEPALAGRAATVCGVLRGMLAGEVAVMARAEAATLLLRHLLAGQPPGQ